MLETETAAADVLHITPHHHAAKFYTQGRDLLETMVDYVAEGLRQDEGILLFATVDHWQALSTHLDASSVSVTRAVERGQLVFVDVANARERLMVRGRPSSARFAELVESQAEPLSAKWSAVRVFSEIADELAGDGQFGPVRQLGEMWRDFVVNTENQVCSAYDMNHFARPDLEEPFATICRLHQRVLAAGAAGGVEVAQWQRRSLTRDAQLAERDRTIAELRSELDAERERHRRKDAFLTNVWSEVRGPLAPVVAAVEIMNLRADEATERERVIIERHLDRLVDTVDDLAGAFDVLFGRETMARQSEDLCEVVRQAMQFAQQAISERGHEVHLDLPEPSPRIEGDASKLAWAIGELLENAARYTPPSGDIWLGAQREAGSVVVSVRDEGVGLTREMIEGSFEPFAKSEREDVDNERGAGLGLAVADAIVTAHHGALAAMSDGVGAGSEFVVRLPLEDSQPEPAGVSRLHREDLAPGARVLVVDDNRDFAQTLAETLELLGHDVYLAHDAAEALQAVDEVWPDLALLDINLPGMDGHDLAKKLTARRPVGRELRLVALTGYGDESRRRRSQQIGFDAHLVKPVVLSQLQETLDSVFSDD